MSVLLSHLDVFASLGEKWSRKEWYMRAGAFRIVDTVPVIFVRFALW
jgi:hypothetical protein